MAVRLAVVGAGLVGEKHLRLAASSPRCQLVGVVDTDPERAAVLAENVACGVTPGGNTSSAGSSPSTGAALSAPRFFSDLATMFREANPDGVIIATPTDTHRAVAEACARSGAHLLVEKPIAGTGEDAWAICRAAEECGVSVLVGHHRRHSRLVRAARDAVAGGELGELLGVSVLWTLTKPDDYYRLEWRTRRPGGGPTLINLIHELDTLRFACGEIESLFARTSSPVRDHEVEECVSVSLRFQSGALGSLFASDATPAPWSYETTTGENPFYFHAPEDCCYFFGTRGSLSFPRLNAWSYADGGPRGWQHPLHVEALAVEGDRGDDPLANQLHHFCDVVEGRAKPVVDGADATRSLLAALAVLESADTGCEITLKR